MKKIERFILLLIFVLAFVLRFYKLTSMPPHLYVDEVAIAYDAYSVNLTGKDQWGDVNPFLFKSYGDYKLPLYVYVTAISQRIFGYNDYAVRFPSALAGFISVMAVYFFAKELAILLGDRLGTRFWLKASMNVFPLLSAMIVAIAPWELQFSRGGFEANLALSFRTVGVALFLYSVRKQIWFLPLSVICFISALYTYHSAAITSPLIFIILSLLFVKVLFRQKKALFVSAVLGLVLITPYIPSYVMSANGRVRFNSESVANMHGNVLENFKNNYLGNYTTDYLFFMGDQQGRHSVKKLGELYLWQLIFIISGVYFLLRYPTRVSAFVFLGLLISNIPPAITRVSPHALRGLLASRYWQILTAFGLVYFLPKLKFKLKFLLIPIIVYSMSLYLHEYYVHYPKAYSLDWQDGHRQTIEYVKTIEQSYDEIFVYKSFVPMYWFMYLPYDPIKLQESGHNDQHFWKITYVDLSVDPIKVNKSKKSLVITPYSYENSSYNHLADIKMYNGDTAFKIYEF